MLKEQEAFILALAENEDDAVTRLVYADWLEENDQPEEADRMRRWRASKDWMMNWVRRINYGPYKKDDQGNLLWGENGDALRDEEGDNYGDPHTYEDAIEAGHAACRGETYCWGSDAGADFFCESRANSQEWWGHWSTLTGKPTPLELDVIQQPPFRCGC